MTTYRNRQHSILCGWSPGNPQSLPSMRIGLFALTEPAEKGKRIAVLRNTVKVHGHQSMGRNVFLKLSVVVSLLLQTIAPCCCAFPIAGSAEGDCEHCQAHSQTSDTDAPPPACGVCDALNTAVDLTSSNREFSGHRLLLASWFQPYRMTTEGLALVCLQPVRCAAAQCDIYEMQTLRE
jgi:hypothetical protein